MFAHPTFRFNALAPDDFHSDFRKLAPIFAGIHNIGQGFEIIFESDSLEWFSSEFGRIFNPFFASEPMRRLSEESLEDLVSRAQNGDHSAFDELFLRVQHDLFKVAVRITRNEGEAEEAMQNALLLIFRKIHHFRGDAQFTTWAHRIAATSALQILRKKRRRPQTIGMESLTPGVTEHALTRFRGGSQCASERLEYEQLAARISDGIEELSEVDRRVMQMYVFDDQPVEDVALELGLTVPAVKSRLHRARKRVRADLQEVAG